MAYTHYYFRISQGPDTSVRAWLNDVPFYRYYGPLQCGRSGPAIHLLKPGENTFAIEIDRAPPESQVFFELMIDFDHEHPAIYFEWPKEALHLPAERRTPFRWEGRFEPEGDLFTPIHLASPPEVIPCEGTPELREAVRRFHAAVEARDLDGFCEGLALKASEFSRAYPGWPDSTAQDMRADMVGFFKEDIRVRPLAMSDVHFEARAGGRLAYATHLGGGFLIDATSPDLTADGERASVSMDLTFTRHMGAWSIVY